MPPPPSDAIPSMINSDDAMIVSHAFTGLAISRSAPDARNAIVRQLAAGQLGLDESRDTRKRFRIGWKHRFRLQGCRGHMPDSPESRRHGVYPKAGVQATLRVLQS